MSAGAFINSRYAANYAAATIHPIRVQPETIAASAAAPGGAVTNDPPADPTTNPISAQVTKSTRSLGLHARLISIKVTGTPPTGYLAGSTVRLPALTPAFAAAAIKGVVITYLGATWEVIGTRAEVTR